MNEPLLADFALEWPDVGMSRGIVIFECRIGEILGATLFTDKHLLNLEMHSLVSLQIIVDGKAHVTVSAFKGRLYQNKKQTKIKTPSK